MVHAEVECGRRNPERVRPHRRVRRARIPAEPVLLRQHEHGGVQTAPADGDSPDPQAGVALLGQVRLFGLFEFYGMLGLTCVGALILALGVCEIYVLAILEAQHHLIVNAVYSHDFSLFHVLSFLPPARH